MKQLLGKALMAYHNSQKRFCVCGKDYINTKIDYEQDGIQKRKKVCAGCFDDLMDDESIEVLDYEGV